MYAFNANGIKLSELALDKFVRSGPIRQFRGELGEDAFGNDANFRGDAAQVLTPTCLDGSQGYVQRTPSIAGIGLMEKLD